MSKQSFTPGPYLRDDRFVYAFVEYQLPSGGVVEVNRFSASVCAGHECPHEEAVAVARLFEAAPDLLNALTVLADAAEARGIPCDAARAAISKALGDQP